MVVEELGWDEDVDDNLRQAAMDILDADLVEESDTSVDAVLLWLRADDGDVMDLLIDCLTDLSDSGYIWVLSPKVGRPGHVPAADLAEGALAAGLATTCTATVSKDWSAHKVVRTKGSRR
jgi:hypothetical protein